MYQHGKLKIRTTGYKYKEMIKTNITKSPRTLSAQFSREPAGVGLSLRKTSRHEGGSKLSQHSFPWKEEGAALGLWGVMSVELCGESSIAHMLTDRHGPVERPHRGCARFKI